MPCSGFAGQETCCARAHGFARPRDSRLSEMNYFTFLRYRASASLEPRTRDHRKQFTGQSPRHGASRMKRAVRTDACAFGATPPRGASIFLRAPVKSDPNDLWVSSAPFLGVDFAVELCTPGVINASFVSSAPLVPVSHLYLLLMKPSSHVLCSTCACLKLVSSAHEAQLPGRLKRA